ncbi:TRAP transporter, DctM subunit subfamily [Verrucomicrobiia bacterium DG1235]|nr:TRAP transporter, DctM subunit subfamily [Verrucomicrobiae bacterium DG1235]
MIPLLFITFFALLFLGVPIAFALGISSTLYLLLADIPLVTLPIKMYSGIDVFVLLSIPGFILAGNLMNACGMTDRIIRFSNHLLGHVRGGLGLANIGSSMVFAGISGTAVADTASIGSIMIPAMKKEGYDAPFACAVTASSSTIGPIIPPSMPMIVAGSLTGLSIGKLFLAGAIPGLLLALGFMIVSYLISKKQGHPVHPRSSARQATRGFIDAFWALAMSALILFGIVGGIFTPTEASIVAVLYAFLVGGLFYRTLTWSSIVKVMQDSASSTASLMLLVGFANLFGWILVSEQIPQAIANSLLSLTDNPIVLLLLINLLLLVVGSFMETLAALLILYPILLKVGEAAGIDPIQFSVMVVLNLIIGLNTPPVGVCLFVASEIGQTPVSKIARAGLPFLAVSLSVLALVSYVPEISLFLPDLLSK